MAHAVFCTVKTSGEATAVVDRLKAAGFTANDISVLMPDNRGIGALAIPGVGPLIAAGPIMAALGGAALGGTAGGVTGALIGMGIPEYEAKRFEGELKGGRCLVSVHSEDSAETEQAEQIFEGFGGEDITTSREASETRRN